MITNPSFIWISHTLQWCIDGRGLVLIGPTGIGKTYLLRALGLLACQKGHTVLFSSFTEFLEYQAMARSQGNFLQFRERYIKPQLLCLDDLGMRKMSSLEAEDLRDIIEQRSYGKSTAITTQLPFDHWSEVISDSIILDALLDRLKEPSEVIILKGPSFRSRIKYENNKKNDTLL